MKGSFTHDVEAQGAAEGLLNRVAVRPQVGLVLGSGLGDLADAVAESVIVPTDEIEGYPTSTVPGHHGRLVFGHLEEVPMVILQGRVHLYEGYSLEEVTYPVRLLGALGVRRLLLTNAAGGIRPDFSPGSLMFIDDHIQAVGRRIRLPAETSASAGRRRLRGPNPYSPRWLDQAERIALDTGVATCRGTYLWVTGPSYETKAEIAAFRWMGADAVGMSTVPEALQAAALNIEVLGISTITNPAAGLSKVPLSHDDVLEAGRQVRSNLERLIRALLRAE